MIIFKLNILIGDEGDLFGIESLCIHIISYEVIKIKKIYNYIYINYTEGM